MGDRHYEKRCRGYHPGSESEPTAWDGFYPPDSTRAYVTCGNTGLIYVLDTSTFHVVDTIQTDYPGGLAISRMM